MTVARVRLAEYRASLPEPWPSAEGLVRERIGAILILEEDGGAVGIGETAPWPGFGLETIGSSVAALRLAARRIIGLPRAHYRGAIADLPRLAQVASTPCARHAIDLALHDLAAQHEGTSIARLLGGDDALSVVSANAVIPRLSAEESARAAVDAVGRGANTVKLKVGSRDPGEDLVRVAAVRDAVGDRVRIRVDANQAWNETQAITILKSMARYDLEYCEQPVAADDVDALARVRAAAGVRIAADEAVRDLPTAQQILDRGAADVLVVKPMALGGLHAAREIATLARDRGIPAVVTSLLESDVGRTGALHLAASLGRTALDHGVGGSKAGPVPVPSAPGLGAAADPATRDAALLLATAEASV